MSNVSLIVLSGEAGAGKDAVADVLVGGHGYEKFSLSEEMKLFCQRVFGWTDDQLWGPSHFRNAPDPKWARPCQACSGTGSVADYHYHDANLVRSSKKCAADGCEAGKINDNSPRRVLQLLGDEWARQMIHPDVWTMSVRSLLERRLAAGSRIVINDARFDNDRTNLHEWLKATRIDVRSQTKKDHTGQTWREHASETSRPTDEQVELVLWNDEEWPFPALSAKVDLALVQLTSAT